ncbi:MAG TPA: hypothetical protein VFR81_21335 [Longimicrobium sp.]|nr:hypothetical protein [Longimicrobium sp.]
MAYEAPDPYGTDEILPPPDGLDVNAEGYRPPDLAGWWDAMTGVWRYFQPTGETGGGGTVSGTGG